MVIVRESLDPTVSGLDWESTGEALGREQLVPVGLAVRLGVLQKEGAVAKQLSAVRAGEALRVVVLSDRVQAVALERKTNR